MANVGYSGYFMKGLASGLTSGVNLGTQLTQLKWQKQKQKELDDLNIKMNDTWNTISQEIVSLANDGQLSDDDQLKIYAMTFAAPYQMQGVLQDLRNSLSQLKTKDFDKQMEYVKTFYEYAQGLDPKDINSLYEGLRPYINDPHALTLYEVADMKLRHEWEAGQAEDISGITKLLPEEYRYPYLKEKGVVGEITPVETAPKAPGITDYKSAVDYLSKFVNAPTDTFNKIKAGFQRQFPNIDMSNITQESLREPEKGTEEEIIKRTDIDYWEDIFKKVKNIDEYNRQMDNLQKTGIEWKPREYKEILIDKVKSMADEIKREFLTTDSKGNVKFIDDEAKENYSRYQRIYEQKVKELMSLYPDINTSQFPKFLSIEEIKPIGFLKGMFTVGGVSKGDYSVIDPKGWF